MIDQAEATKSVVYCSGSGDLPSSYEDLADRLRQMGRAYPISEFTVAFQANGWTPVLRRRGGHLEDLLDGSFGYLHGGSFVLPALRRWTASEDGGAWMDQIEAEVVIDAGPRWEVTVKFASSADALLFGGVL